tara:strand:+ start:270 stop:506 length:237 start_codon:yes stop_codon:yes gene_type:complete
MSEVIITPDSDGLYNNLINPPMETKMKMEQDIVIDTTKGLEVIPIPEQTPYQVLYDLPTEGSITIKTTGESEVFNVPN